MAYYGPFKPSGPALSVALTTASVATATALPGGGETVVVFNATAVPVAVDFQAATFTLTVAAAPIIVPAGQRMAVEVARDTALFAAAIPIGTASASVYFMRGQGTGT